MSHSLIEFIIVIMLSSLLLVGGAFLPIRRENQSKRIESFLRLAQLAALLKTTPIIVYHRSNQIYFSTGGNKKERLRLTTPITFPKNQQLSFYPTGVQTPATIRIKSKPLCRIILSLRGRINRLCHT